MQNPLQTSAWTWPRLQALCSPDLLGYLRLPPAPTIQEAELGQGSCFLARAVSKVWEPEWDMMMLQVAGLLCSWGCPQEALCTETCRTVTFCITLEATEGQTGHDRASDYLSALWAAIIRCSWWTDLQCVTKSTLIYFGVSLLFFLKVHLFTLHIPRKYNGGIAAILWMDSAVELVLKNHHLVHGIWRILQLHQLFKVHGHLLGLALCSVFPQPVKEPRQSAMPIEKWRSPFESLQVRMSRFRWKAWEPGSGLSPG